MEKSKNRLPFFRYTKINVGYLQQTNRLKAIFPIYIKPLTTLFNPNWVGFLGVHFAVVGVKLPLSKTR